MKWRCPSTAGDSNVLGDSSQSIKKSKASCDGKGNFSRQNERVVSCILLIRTPFTFLFLLGLCFRNLIFCDLGGKVKHFRLKVVKDGPPNSREFATFGIPSEPKCKRVLAKSRLGNGSSDIVFFFLA